MVLIFVPAGGDRVDGYIRAIGETGRQTARRGRVCENITGVRARLYSRRQGLSRTVELNIEYGKLATENTQYDEGTILF